MTPDGAETALTDRSWLEDVARRRGHPVSLRIRADAEADPAPLHLISVPTVRFLEKQYGGPLEPERLRSNVLLELPDGASFRGRPLARPPALDRRRAARDRRRLGPLRRSDPRRRDGRAIARHPVGDRAGPRRPDRRHGPGRSPATACVSAIRSRSSTDTLGFVTRSSRADCPDPSASSSPSPAWTGTTAAPR